MTSASSGSGIVGSSVAHGGGAVAHALAASARTRCIVVRADRWRGPSSIS